jgi:hypothetical protein
MHIQIPINTLQPIQTHTNIKSYPNLSKSIQILSTPHQTLPILFKPIQTFLNVTKTCPNKPIPMYQNLSISVHSYRNLSNISKHTQTNNLPKLIKNYPNLPKHIQSYVNLSKPTSNYCKLLQTLL